jgi:hypothetical protein
MGKTLTTLHFDLRHMDSAHEYKLKAFGVDYRLKRHSPESISAARLENQSLNHIPTERITHFADAVALDDDKVHLLRVKGPKVMTKEGFEIESLALMSLHIPAAAVRTARTRSIGAKRAPAIHPKLAFYGVTAIPSEQADAVHDGLGQMITPHDTAVAIVGMHHELTALDPDPASSVQPHLQQADGLAMLAAQVGSSEPWNVPRVIMSDTPGEPLKDPSGNIVYQYDLTDTTTNLVRAPVKHALRQTKNDQSLKNLTWHHLDGRTATTSDRSAASAPSTLGADDGRYAYALTKVSTQWGLNGTLLQAQEASDGFHITLELQNTFTRFLSVYVQFVGANGNPIVPNHWDSRLGPLPAAFENDTTKYLGVERNRDTIMGIPCPSPKVNWAFTIPKDQTVVKARILAGGLGRWWLNAPEDRIAAWMGLAETSVLNFGLPTFFLVQGIGVTGSTQFKLLYNDLLFWGKTAWAMYEVVKDLVERIGNTDDGLKALFEALIDTFLKTVIYDTVVLGFLIAELTAEEVAEMTPFAGIALKVALCVAAGAEILETTVECLASPMVYDFDLVTTMNDLNVTVHPDRKSNHGFPNSAVRYKITQRYTQNSARVRTYDLDVANQATLRKEFHDVPVGGHVEILVDFYSVEGWVVGRGSSGLIVNQVPAGQTSLDIDVTITEELYPLTERTLYQHKQKLGFRNGAHEWISTADAPVATRAVLNPEPGGHNLSQVNAIRLSDDTGVLSYSWCASGQDIPPIDRHEPSNVQLHSFQNIGIGGAPDNALMLTPAGFSSEPALAVRRSSRATAAPTTGVHPNGAGAMQFFIDPRGTPGTGFHLRKVTQIVDPKLPPDDPARYVRLDDGQSWGRFAVMPDDLEVHPNGYVIGVSKSHHKLHVLRLAAKGVADDQAPWAQDLSGLGDRPGLVTEPQLTTVTSDGRCLVLEAGTNRIQAFDPGGNPVSCFDDFPEHPTWIPLWAQPSDPQAVTYQAMSAEIEGYIYVLSYEKDGKQSQEYRLDIYAPLGRHLCRTRGVTAASMTVDLWRNLFAVNYETVLAKGDRTEPSVSEWIPQTSRGV